MLGEAYSTHDEEDMTVKEVTAISISQGRYSLGCPCTSVDLGLMDLNPPIASLTLDSHLLLWTADKQASTLE